MSELSDIFLAKAEESLVSAESELANGRHNNCANRCYYACFQAAVSALIHSGMQPTSKGQKKFRHTFVQAQFVEQLINHRKLYKTTIKDTLARTLVLRQMADYEAEQVSQIQAYRALRRAREFLAAVQNEASGH
jgi:uncharacterized protein (UPF0332 family)